MIIFAVLVDGFSIDSPINIDIIIHLAEQVVPLDSLVFMCVLRYYNEYKTKSTNNSSELPYYYVDMKIDQYKWIFFFIDECILF